MSSTLKLSADASSLNELPPALSEYATNVTRLERRSHRGETPRVAPPPFDKLSHEASRAVVTRWNRPCIAAFELLAVRFPSELAKLIREAQLDAPDLTFAAEALGRSNMSWLVRHALKPLLSHASAVVREGAIYGLQKHIDADIREALEAVANNDASPAVRMAADDALSDP